MFQQRVFAASRALFAVTDVITALLLIAITGLNLSAVFMRYVMLDSIAWSEEIMRYGSVWLTFLAAATVSYRNEHLSLEFLHGVGSPAVQKAHRVALHVLAALFGAFVLWQGIIYCGKSGMQTAPTTGLPMLVAYSAIAVGGGLIMVAELVRAWETLVQSAPDDDTDDLVHPTEGGLH